MSVLSHLWLLVLLSLCCAPASQAHGTQRTLPCPAPEDVFPCVCTSDWQHNMDMDCSQVESEDQLRQVFSAYLPFPEFHELKIDNNEHLRVIREGDLGLASFRLITITHGILTEVEPGALTQSASIIREIHLYDNQLTKFPFEELPSWTSLYSLDLGRNALNVFPVLVSDSLHLLKMNVNLFTDIPADAFKATPKLTMLYVDENSLKKITPGLFSGLNNLWWVDLSRNHLTEISNGDFSLTEGGRLILIGNSISSIAVGGITGPINGDVSLIENALTSLPEEVFRPILEGGTLLWIRDNPLGCGCDIAWLITNDSFMDLIAPGAPCYDGTPLFALDPTIYEDLCYR